MSEPEYTVTEVSTVEASCKERSELWVAHVREMQGAFGLSFTDTTDFVGSTKVQSWRDIAVVEFTSDAIEYRRSTRHVAGDGKAEARILVPLDGDLVLTQKRETCLIESGSLGLFDMESPMSMAHKSGARALIINIPAGVLTRRLAGNTPLLLQPQRPLVSMLVSHLHQMAAHRDVMTGHEFAHSIRLLFQHLEAVLDPDESHANHVRDLATTAERARRHVVRHSDDPHLTPESLAAALGCSVSYLHKCLRETKDGTPGRLIRTVRLERAHDRLRFSSLSIEQIATKSGLGSPDTLRSNFLKHFKKTPRQVRAEATFRGNVEAAPDR